MPEMRLARTILSVDDIEKMVNRVAGELNEVLVDVDRPVFSGVMKLLTCGWLI
jgi:hypoxanthine phosphoribosyltransferase